METVKIERRNTKIIAHRGLSGIECENTAAAFVAAGNRDYYGIETDVHKTLDGKYIIIHDDTTDRVADKGVSVEKSEFEYLRKLRLFDKDGKIRGDLCLPTLGEYLRIGSKYNKVCVLELKNAFDKDSIAEIVKKVKKLYSMDQLIFISFDYKNLVMLRELEPEANEQFLYADKVNKKLIDKCKAYHLDLDIYYEYLNSDNIAELHRNNIKVNCWTVDDKKAAEKLTEYGVDYITTNILQ